MARIVGVDLPKNKRGEIGLTYIYGIGRSTARKILDEAGISYDLKVQDWSDDRSAQFVRRSRIWVSRSRANAVRSYSSISNV